MNDEKQNGIKNIPEILIKGEAYNLLISNKKISFRKKLFEKLNQIFTPGSSIVAWKSRYLYPEANIPRGYAEKYSESMSDMLIYTLQEQVDYLIDQKKDIDQLIEKSLQIINTYKNE